MAYASAFAVTTKAVLAGMLLALPQKAPCSSVWSRRAETESSFLLILPCISLIAVPMPSLIAWVPWLSFADASVISLVASPSWAYPAWIFARPSLMPARPWLNCALASLALSSVALAVAVACWAEARFAFASAVAWSLDLFFVHTVGINCFKLSYGSCGFYLLCLHCFQLLRRGIDELAICCSLMIASLRIY